MRNVLSAVLALMALCGLAGLEAQGDHPLQTFGTAVDLVEVDVTVLDKNRRPIEGLQAADFTLLVDGKPQRIAGFAAVAVPPRATPTKADWARSVPSDIFSNGVGDEGRLVVIVMDRSIPIGFPALTAHKIAKAAIEQLRPGDLAAVVYTGAGAPQDFTDDRARLLAAIGDNPAGGLQKETADRWEVQKDQLEAELWEPPDPASPKPPRILQNDYSGECYCGLCVLDAIKNIADAVRDTHGRKKTLLFIGTDLVTDSADPQCQYPVTDAREAMFTSIDLAGLTVDAFDANGLQSNVVAASSQGENLSTPVSPRPGAQTLAPARSQQLLLQQGHLAVLPARTGGRTVVNTNDPDGRVPDIFRESDVYYLLGFEPATDGRAHTISVQVNRRDAAVQSRRAYIAASPAARPSPRATDLNAGAIARVIPERHGLTLTAKALAVAAPGTHDPAIVVALQAQHDAVSAALPSTAETVEIVTAVFTYDGRPVGTFRQTLSVRGARLPVPAAAAGLAYDVVQRIPAKPGRYQLRIAVHDPARNQNGSVFASVDIPAWNKTAFAWSEVGVSSAAVTPAAKDNVADVVSAVPIARRGFDRQEHVTVFINAYHVSGALPSPIQIETTITDEQNHRRFSQKASLTAADFDPTGAAAYKADLPLATLTPGAYLVTMETTAGKTKTTRYVQFSVQ